MVSWNGDKKVFFFSGKKNPTCIAVPSVSTPLLSKCEIYCVSIMRASIAASESYETSVYVILLIFSLHKHRPSINHNTVKVAKDLFTHDNTQ